MSLNITALVSRNHAFRDLFANGEQGVWLDPSDFSTMFQDTAGTTPVTAAGQYVALIRDKSGRGNHASQATSTKRPMLVQDAAGMYGLRFDGVDDALICAGINLTSTDKYTATVGVRTEGTSTGMIYEFSPNYNANASSFYLVGPSTINNYGVNAKGTTNGGDFTAGGYIAPSTDVITVTADIAGASRALRIDGVLKASSAASIGTGNFGNYALYIGARGGSSLFFKGNIYGLVLRGAASTSQQIGNAEARMNNLTRAY